MFIFISFRDSDIHELILRKQMALKKSYATGYPPKKIVFKQTEK